MKSFSVKEWFANKIANEIRMNISSCDLFAILRETEKAVYALVDLGRGHSRTMWIPKSCLVECEVGDDANGRHHYETLQIADYNEARARFEAFRADFN